MNYKEIGYIRCVEKMMQLGLISGVSRHQYSAYT